MHYRSLLLWVGLSFSSVVWGKNAWDQAFPASFRTGLSSSWHSTGTNNQRRSAPWRLGKRPSRLKYISDEVDKVLRGRGGGGENTDTGGFHLPTHHDSEQDLRDLLVVAPRREVLLFYPNLIGYARVALVLSSFYFAEINWRVSSLCYLTAFLGDAMDGLVARKFNQASRFGCVLDMVTDRCSTAGLLLVLSRLYGRRESFAFILLMFIDIFSHWMHCQSVLGHHKARATLERRNALIRLYYENMALFGYCCVGSELFYVMLYLLKFVPDARLGKGPVRVSLSTLCWYGCMPACLCKQVVNLVQMGSAFRSLADEG